MTEFVERLKAGFDGPCPCCGRYAKIYKRALHKGIAMSLIRLYNTGGANGYIHISRFCTVAGGVDIPLARFWGLVEQRPNDDATKRTGGYWRLTPHGVDFVERRTTIPKYVLLYNNKLVGTEGRGVSIKDCLTDKFDYSQLMQLS